MKNEPWDDLQSTAEHVRRSYQPGGDSSPPVRRDLQLLMDASFTCRLAVDSARSSEELSLSPETNQALDVIDELFVAFAQVMQGVAVQTRDLARQCRAAADGAHDPDEIPAMLDRLATELHQLVGPGSADCG